MALLPIAGAVLARDIDDLLPQKGRDFHSEIACYSLPYGALGFVSHLLTYYTIACLWNGRSPLWPARKVAYSSLDLWLGVFALLGSSGMAIFTLARCRNTWQLLTIGVWKLSVSLVNGITAVNVAALVSRAHKRNAEKAAEVDVDASDTSGWIALYIPGLLAGISGLMSLVVQNWDIVALRKLTIAFYTIVGLGLGIAILVILNNVRRRDLSDGMETFWTGVSASFGIFMVLAALYSDWAIAIMAHNLTGLPSGDNSAFYWTYFFAKRLTMFTW
ncbi:hypothetical protein BDN72DRAFT_451227 [Pluteus cervinus]|uniref:Uncharacterized protein n=1 Tax=Pluteus cervinus TaxID=181527 RepID=A0ACD3BDJ7_9AGAR|nr:hypothetical protein BDN72DRAFT_451227 [Pluteus cervinus]